MKISIFLILFLILFSSQKFVPADRGEVGIYQDKFIWTESQEAFVPNYLMIDMLSSDLSEINETNLDEFINGFMVGHGFNGLHVPVYGQWFHIGEKRVSPEDSLPDLRTFEKLKMIINKVYEAGGCTHLWVWGDDQRSQTSKSTKGGIMGIQEQKLMDKIHEELNPLKGWSMGYGFDLFEWVTEKELDSWHEYMWSKTGWNHLLGARARKNEIGQISKIMDYSSYEYHKPWYDKLVKMLEAVPAKPSFSEDRYRIRHPSKYPKKDYNPEETRRGLWHHTMAGGIAAIWGNLDGDGFYPNKEAIKCFFTFWNSHKRFKKDMISHKLSDGQYLLQSEDKLYVFYQENSEKISYSFEGKKKKVKLVDTRKAYKEIEIDILKPGPYTFKAPYLSDWALVVEMKK